MKKGFFDFENDDGYDFLKKLKINNEEINAFFYLHGICHEFALGLCETFNYNIVLWINYDEDINSNVLIHAFNTFKYKGNQYYIDIRGITDNIDDITDGQARKLPFFDCGDELPLFFIRHTFQYLF